uniref:C2H2-type domain-containing protein n=1 Tax=Mola mola TaxID=94237 RepID=A0A3Q3WRC4_MOLML
MLYFLCFYETELKASTAEKLEQLPVGYLADSSTSGLPFDQNAEQVVSTGDIEEPSMSINDTEESFNPYVIAIEEEDDDDDDLRFVQESQQEPSMSAADGPCHSKRQTKPDTLFENSSALDKYTHGGCSMRAVETAKASKKERFTCRICSRTFFHKGTLTQHMKSHKSDSKSCELCGKKFANPSALRIHNVVHTGEQPYRCSLCGKGFTQKGNLKCHLRIHTGEKPFRCANCGKTFRQKVNLNQHLMAHRNLEVGESKTIRKTLKLNDA